MMNYLYDLKAICLKVFSRKGTWRSGEYFKTENEAKVEFFMQQQNSLDKSFQYQNHVKWIMKEELINLFPDLEDDELDRAYEEWFRDDRFTSVMDKVAIETITDFIVEEREELERGDNLEL